MFNDPKGPIPQPEVEETAALEGQIAASLAQLNALPELLKKWRRLYIEEVAQLEEQAFIREEDVVRLQNENRSKEELIRVHTETIARLEKENRSYAREAAQIRKEGSDTVAIEQQGHGRCQQVLPVSKNPDPLDHLFTAASRPPRRIFRPIVLLSQRKRKPAHAKATTPVGVGIDAAAHDVFLATAPSLSAATLSQPDCSAPSSAMPLPTVSTKRFHPDSSPVTTESPIRSTKRTHTSAPVPAGPSSLGPSPPKAQIEGAPNTAPSVPGVIYTDDATMKLSNRIRRKCFNCRTTDTPTWRHSNLAPGKVLCNGCGIFENTHSHPRPEPSLRKRRRIVKNRTEPHDSTPPSVDHRAPVSVQMPLNTPSLHHRDPGK